MRLFATIIVSVVSATALTEAASQPPTSAENSTNTAGRPPSVPLARYGLRADVVGCFALRWTPRRPPQQEYYRASAQVRLDTAVRTLRTPRSVPGVARQLARLDAGGRAMDTVAARTWAAPPAWSADSLTDSIRVSFLDGFSGAMFVFAAAPGADTLPGRAENHWDSGPPFVTDLGTATAVRVYCHADRSRALAS